MKVLSLRSETSSLIHCSGIDVQIASPASYLGRRQLEPVTRVIMSSFPDSLFRRILMYRKNPLHGFSCFFRDVDYCLVNGKNITHLNY